MTLFGGLIALGCLIFKLKPKKWDYSIWFELPGNWGGFEAGIFFFTSLNPNENIKCHEHGHGIQNCYFGIFMPFVISIPSCIRYWYRESIYKKDKIRYYTLPPYDSIWFEDSATKLGTALHEWLKNKK